MVVLKMNLLCYAVLCYVLVDFVKCGVLYNTDLYRLDIVHYNDFHDRFEETSVPYPVCKTNDPSCLGGFSRLYYEIKLLLREKPGALLLNAGDTFQGTYWYTLLKWSIIQKFINMLPNDAHTIGNHEFDDGVGGLVPYLAALQAPVLVANMDTTKEPTLNGLFKPHTIIEKRGRRIGIIGLITPDTETSSNSQDVVFLDPVETAKNEAQLLTDKGVDIIILLSHCGIEVDKRIAKEVGENIDIIVGGHTHSLLWNGASPSKENITGPYPVEVETESKPGHKVLVVTASAFTKYLGNITTYFDKQGELKSFNGEPVFLNRSIPEDPDIVALLKPYKDELHTQVHEVVGFTNDDLLAAPCGSQECAIGDLTADSFLDKAKEMNASNLTHVSFLLRNMIRGSIGSGEINRGAVINTLPFTNKVVTFRLLGRYFVQALELCLTQHWELVPFNGPWMPQVAGVRVTLNTTIKQAVSVLVKEGGEYLPIELDKEYQVTTVKFLLRSGHGFKMLNEFAQNVTLIGKDADILENYIRKLSPITPALDNRLTVVN